MLHETVSFCETPSSTYTCLAISPLVAGFWLQCEAKISRTSVIPVWMEGWLIASGLQGLGESLPLADIFSGPFAPLLVGPEE
jgi:hypothetical protein